MNEKLILGLQVINLIENDLRARRCSKARLKYDFFIIFMVFIITPEKTRR